MCSSNAQMKCPIIPVIDTCQKNNAFEEKLTLLPKQMVSIPVSIPFKNLYTLGTKHWQFALV